MGLSAVLHIAPAACGARRSSAAGRRRRARRCRDPEARAPDARGTGSRRGTHARPPATSTSATSAPIRRGAGSCRSRRTRGACPRSKSRADSRSVRTGVPALLRTDDDIRRARQRRTRERLRCTATGNFAQRLMWVIWPAFLVAGVADRGVLHVFDPSNCTSSASAVEIVAAGDLHDRLLRVLGAGHRVVGTHGVPRALAVGGEQLSARTAGAVGGLPET